MLVEGFIYFIKSKCFRQQAFYPGCIISLSNLIIPYVLHNRYQKFFEAADHDKNEKDHSKHLGFEAFKRVYEFYNYLDDQEALFSCVNLTERL